MKKSKTLKMLSLKKQKHLKEYKTTTNYTILYKKLIL